MSGWWFGFSDPTGPQVLWSPVWGSGSVRLTISATRELGRAGVSPPGPFCRHLQRTPVSHCWRFVSSGCSVASGKNQGFLALLRFPPSSICCCGLPPSSGHCRASSWRRLGRHVARQRQRPSCFPCFTCRILSWFRRRLQPVTSGADFSFDTPTGCPRPSVMPFAA